MLHLGGRVRHSNIGASLKEEEEEREECSAEAAFEHRQTDRCFWGLATRTEERICYLVDHSGNDFSHPRDRNVSGQGRQGDEYARARSTFSGPPSNHLGSITS